MRGFAAAALALAGFLFAWTPVAERIDLALLDAQIAFLHKLGPRPAPDDIIIVGVDDTDLREIPEPAGLWHEPVGRVLARIGATKPRAIGLDLPLPDRSYDAFRPGIDRVLLAGLAAAREGGPLVASLDIDARTRTAKTIHTPYLAILGDEGLGIGLFGRDADGVIRQFSLAIPTEDGSFPTFAGRICRAVSKTCRDGHIDFSLGVHFRYVPFREVLRANDKAFLEKLFKGRIVLVGGVQRHSGRFEVPMNLAGWEPGGATSPGVVVHAVSLRTALYGKPASPTRKPVLLLLISAAALLVFMREGRLALVSALLAGVMLFALATAALRVGWVVPIAATLATLAAAGVASLVLGRRKAPA